jgi:hypothetical protein
MTRRGGDAETRRVRNRIGIPVSPCPRVPVSVLIPQLSDTPVNTIRASGLKVMPLSSGGHIFAIGGRSRCGRTIANSRDFPIIMGRRA